MEAEMPEPVPHAVPLRGGGVAEGEAIGTRAVWEGFVLFGPVVS